MQPAGLTLKTCSSYGMYHRNYPAKEYSSWFGELAVVGGVAGRE